MPNLFKKEVKSFFVLLTDRLKLNNIALKQCAVQNWKPEQLSKI